MRRVDFVEDAIGHDGCRACGRREAQMIRVGNRRDDTAPLVLPIGPPLAGKQRSTFFCAHHRPEALQLHRYLTLEALGV